MENFILLEEDNTALDICKAETLEDAKDIFALRGWIADNVISQKDLIENTIKSLDTWASKKMFQVLHPVGGKTNDFCKEDQFEYEIVCGIKATNKEDIFILTQNDLNSEYAALKHRSTSVGDIVINVETGQAWFIDNIGFKEIENPESIEIIYNFPAPDPLPGEFITPSLS